MSNSVGSITDIALNGLLRAQQQADTAAQNIAGAGTTQGSAITQAGPPLTGTQPGNVAGQVQQALGPSSGGSSDLTTNLVSLLNARNSFAANLDTLRAGERIARQAVDIIS